jgi:hypothetical protein
MTCDIGRLPLVGGYGGATEAEASRDGIGGVLIELFEGTGVLAIFNAETLESLISTSSSSSLPKLAPLLFGVSGLLCWDQVPSGSIVTCSTDLLVFESISLTYLERY